MFNLVYWFVGILEELGVVSEEGYHALAKELSTKILPSNSKDALKQVQDAFKAVEKDMKGNVIKVEPWLLRIDDLEKRLAILEKGLTSKKK